MLCTHTIVKIMQIASYFMFISSKYKYMIGEKADCYEIYYLPRMKTYFSLDFFKYSPRKS
jgi:hypothetical protein